jgi:hypothetical protein
MVDRTRARNLCVANLCPMRRPGVLLFCLRNSDARAFIRPARGRAGAKGAGFLRGRVPPCTNFPRLSAVEGDLNLSQGRALFPVVASQIQLALLNLYLVMDVG